MTMTLREVQPSGLTGVSVGVITPRKRICQNRCVLRYWQRLHLYTVRRQCELQLISMRDARNWENEKSIADLNSL